MIAAIGWLSLNLFFYWLHRFTWIVVGVAATIEDADWSLGLVAAFIIVLVASDVAEELTRP
jgi:hypothetical protein